MLAQSMQPATTLLEAIIVHAMQDLNLVEEDQCSRAWKNLVKMWMSAPGIQLFVVPPSFASTRWDPTAVLAQLDSLCQLFRSLVIQQMGIVQI